MGSQRVWHDWVTELNWTGLGTLTWRDLWSEYPALPLVASRWRTNPSFRLCAAAQAQPAHILGSHSTLRPRDIFPLRTAWGDKWLWDKCLHMTTSAGKRVLPICALTSEEGPCQLLSRLVFFFSLNSSTESSFSGSSYVGYFIFLGNILTELIFQQAWVFKGHSGRQCMLWDLSQTQSCFVGENFAQI